MQLVQSTMGLKECVKLPKIVMKNGGTYEGEWLNGMRHGEGTHVYLICISRLGVKEDIMLVNGVTIWHMDRVNWCIWMEMYMKEIGRMIWLMVMEPIHILEVLNMRDSGRMICKMATVLRNGLMVLNTRLLLNFKRLG